MNKISVSQINRHEACPMRWLMQKVKGFRGSSNFDFGLAYHHGLETNDIESALHYLENTDIIEHMKKEYLHKCRKKNETAENKDEEFEAEYKRLLSILPSMLKRHANFIKSNNIKVIDNEVGAIIPLTKTIKLDMRIDRVVEMNRLCYLMEDKSASRMDMSNVEHNFQSKVYLAMVEDFYDKHISGLIFTKNVKKDYDEPRILKSGQLSTAKSQKCNPEEYMIKAYEIYGDDIPDAVQDCYEAICDNRELFDYRFITITDTEKKFIRNQLKLKGRELSKIQNLYEKNKETPDKILNKVTCNFSSDCYNMCSYYFDCLGLRQ